MMLEKATGWMALAWFGALSVAGGAACRSKGQASGSRSTAAPSSSVAPASSLAGSVSATKPASAPYEAVLERQALDSALAHWNLATNAADERGLEAAYAKNLSLYERIVTRSEAVKRKLDYVRKHPGFTQTLEQPSWSDTGEQRIAKFRKTSSSQDVPASSVDAYLVFKQSDGAWRIVDEGDLRTARKVGAGVDTARRNWKERVWDCPDCSDPVMPDDPPIASPPLGPDRVKALGPVPPGAPETVEYGRAGFPRFASAVDVPLFLKATAQSANGDGRWFYYDAPSADAGAPSPSAEPKHLLYCSIGGHFSYGNEPAKAKLDPGHVGEPKVRYTTLFEKRDGELYYERYIFADDGVMNFVYCTFDPVYEAYFYAIVQRMGRSMRAISGGQTERVQRASQPYGVE